MSTKVQLITPDNQLVEGPAEGVADAISNGYKLATPEALAELKNQQTYGEGVGNEAKAFIQGAGEGATFGFSTPAAVKLGLTTQEAANQRAERNPISHGAGLLTGIVGSSAVLPGGGAVGAAREASQGLAEGAANLLPATGSKVLNYARGIGQEALGSGIEGSLYGLGQSASEGQLGDPKLNAQKIMANVGSGALVGGIIGGGVGAIKGLIPEAIPTAETLLENQKTTPEMSAQVADVRELIGKAKDGLIPELDHWQGGLNEADQALASPQKFAASAHDALSSAKDALNGLEATTPEAQAAKNELLGHLTQHLGNGDVWGDEVAGLVPPTGTTGERLLTKVASSAFGVPKDAIEAQIANPEGFAKAGIPLEFAQKFKDALAGVKSDLSADSTAAREMIASTGESVNVSRFTTPLREAADKLESQAYSPKVEKQASLLRKLIANLEEKAGGEGGEIPLEAGWDVKKQMGELIDGLVTKRQNFAAGQYTQAKKGIDQFLKDQVPGYGAHMVELAKDAKTFSELGNTLSSDSGIQNFVKRVGKGGGDTFEKQALAKFDQNFGTDFLGEARMTWAKDAFTKASTNGSRKAVTGKALGSSFGAMVGSPLGPAGALVGQAIGGAFGAAGGAYLDTNGGEVLLKLMSRAEHLTAIEQSINKATNAASTAVKGIFSNAPSAASAVLIKPMTSDEHEKFAGDLAHLSNNIDLMSDHVGAFTDPVFQSAPQHAGALAEVSTNAINFLTQKLPPVKQSSPFNKTPKHSQSELVKFGKYLHAVQQPMSSLSGIKQGIVTPEALEAVKAVYPDLYQDLQARMISEVSGLKDPTKVDYKTRLGVSKFVGMPLDASLDARTIGQTQAIYAQSVPEDQKPGAPVKSGIDLGSRFLTTAQASTSRSDV